MSELHLLVETSQKVALTPRRSEKTRALADYLRQVEEDAVAIAVLYLSGEVRQGKIGVGIAALRAAGEASAIDVPQLHLLQVDHTLAQIAQLKGPGSAAERARQLRTLFERATVEEQHFLFKLLSGELRQGALAGVMLDAIARAAAIPTNEIRRAAMYAPNLGVLAQTALHDERSALLKFQLATLSPVAPMLAETAESVADAFEQLRGGEIVLEWKVDGARIQVHKHGDAVRLYTRSLNDVTHAAPEVVEIVRAFAARELVLDGEVVALDGNDRPLPFQVTMRRFGSKSQSEALRKELPLQPFFFDCLKLDDQSLADRPARERFALLDKIVAPQFRMPQLFTSNLAEAQTFYSDALAAGHEGAMAKSLDSPYEAGKRGACWLKIKHAHTLDLVVLAAEWGHGRRTGKLSNLHLGARDPSTGDFVMLGKTFKGLTDKMLEWQTQEFLQRELRRDDWTVYVRPDLVVEIAFNDIQASSQYPGGYALRFARVKQYRSDKSAADADTIDTIRTLYERQSGVERLKERVMGDG
jgi:DNA ligase-1